MKIKAIPEPYVPGDFGAAVQDDTLTVPTTVASSLAAMSITTAEDLLSYVQAFPNAVACQLGWSVVDLHTAAERLTTTLEGHVDEGLLHQEPELRRGFGARDPSLYRSELRKR